MRRIFDFNNVFCFLITLFIIHTHNSYYSNRTEISFWWNIHRREIVNPLAPGKFEWNFRYLIFQIISVTDGWGISCELALRWISLDLTDDKATLVQVIAWCRQATSHYLGQCSPRSLSPYGVTRPQWVQMITSSASSYEDFAKWWHLRFSEWMIHLHRGSYIHLIIV